MRYFATLTVALTCAFGLAVNAQEHSKEKTKIKGGAAQTVSYTGCYRDGRPDHHLRIEQRRPGGENGRAAQGDNRNSLDYDDELCALARLRHDNFHKPRRT